MGIVVFLWLLLEQLRLFGLLLTAAYRFHWRAVLLL
jgi:hypothetical protein